MKVGDLVRYTAVDAASFAPPAREYRGIIVAGPVEGWMGHNEARQYEVVWYTTETEIKGWWAEKYLELLSESR